MWLLPLLIVGALAAAVARRSKSKREVYATRRLPPAAVGYALPAGPGAGHPGSPGPIATLGEMLSIGQAPPPDVILCAIEEAQAIGRHDLASDIVQAFIEPIIRIRTIQQVQPPVVMPYERGSCAPARGGRSFADACYRGPSSPPFTAVPVATAPAESGVAAPPNVDEFTAMLNSDPTRFMEMVSRNGTIPQAAPAQASAAPSQPAGSPDPGSPLPGVPDANWCDFIARLRRESPKFNSARHVGQYRQRRERLAELAIDPASILDSPQAQRAALDADLVDAYRHGSAGNLFAQHLGRPVSVPGRDGDETITLSGVLGVIQVAGLEGAVNWLERPGDRKRYPHTTQTFLHTNNVF